MAGGAPIGSRNRASSMGQFQAAIKRAIAQDDGKRLRAAAEKLLDKAADGELWAIKELADRLDGRSLQPVEHRDAPPRELSDAELLERIHRREGALQPAPSSEVVAGLH